MTEAGRVRLCVCAAIAVLAGASADRALAQTDTGSATGSIDLGGRHVVLVEQFPPPGLASCVVMAP